MMHRHGLFLYMYSLKARKKGKIGRSVANSRPSRKPVAREGTAMRRARLAANQVRPITHRLIQEALINFVIG